MPNYDYTCKTCGAKHQRIVPIAARNSQTCHCGNPLTRVFLMPAVKVYPDQSDILPRTDTEKKAWHEQGVGNARWI